MPESVPRRRLPEAIIISAPAAHAACNPLPRCKLRRVPLVFAPVVAVFHALRRNAHALHAEHHFDTDRPPLAPLITVESIRSAGIYSYNPLRSYSSPTSLLAPRLVLALLAASTQGRHSPTESRPQLDSAASAAWDPLPRRRLRRMLIIFAHVVVVAKRSIRRPGRHSLAFVVASFVISKSQRPLTVVATFRRESSSSRFPRPSSTQRPLTVERHLPAGNHHRLDSRDHHQRSAHSQWNATCRREIILGLIPAAIVNSASPPR